MTSNADGFDFQGENAPFSNAETSRQTFADPRLIVDFWRERYLDAYIAPGGSKIKFITGPPGSGKSHCLRLFLSAAEDRGHKNVSLSAKKVWMHDFKEIYVAILNAVDLPACLQTCARDIVAKMGYRFEDIPSGMNFAEHLVSIGAFDPIARLELRNRLSAMFFKNPRIDKNFAVCVALMTGGVLGHPTLESASRDLLFAWLTGDKSVRLPALRKLGLSPFKITKHNARHMLRSLIEILRLVGYAGLVVGMDDLDVLVENSSLEEIRYTKMRREDAYESVRELIDEIDTLSHVMFVFAFDRKLLTDESAGLKSYQALWMRIQNEIESQNFNRFSDMIDMAGSVRALREPQGEILPTCDYRAAGIIEALRSGVPSREVGYCFSSARPKIMREIGDALEHLAESRQSGGRIISGKYGEGKTHLLNTIINMAQERNMAVSTVTLSKETPLSSLHVLYPKILQGTYLPGQVQPGLSAVFERLSSGSPVVAPLLEYCLTGLETNKLYYVLKSYLGTQDDEEKYLLLGDIEGNFMANATLRQIYRRIYGEPAVFNVSFAKSRHLPDYFAFLSRLFAQLGYSGWVLLFDEAELIGRLGKKSRQRAYINMASLLKPPRTEAAYAIFAFNASYTPDVIEAKHEHANLEDALLPPEERSAIDAMLTEIASATQLLPLNREETLDILGKICQYHGQAYGWRPNIDLDALLSAAEKHGYLLRTRIRTTVEMLDQLYQYGEVGDIRVNALGRITFEEDDASLDAFVRETDGEPT
jgi:Cdc6-like AAA superfamily ATPase